MQEAEYTSGGCTSCLPVVKPDKRAWNGRTFTTNFAYLDG